jgi:polyhydroxybutyrate depolymerase
MSVAVILAIALAGCAPTPGSTSPATASASVPWTPAPSASAGPTPTTVTPAISPAPKRQDSIAIGGDERTVDLFVPPIPVGELVPLIVLLHPNGGSPSTIEQSSDIGVLAAREQLIVALPPAASDHRWKAMIDPGADFEESSDEAYVVGLIEHLRGTAPIDPARVYLAGLSMGAVLSDRIACRFPDAIAAIAMVAGAPWSDACSPTRPVSVLVLHGTEDVTFRIQRAGEVVARWRTIDACEGEPEAANLGASAESELHAACNEGSAVQFVRYVGSGHVWFRDPPATELLWEFFEVHQRP